jgi:predicted nucleic acid-binding Zn ribbon protein
MSSRKYTDQSLKTVISELLKNSGLDKKFNEMEVIRCYKEVVGEVVARKTREIYLKEKTLVIKLDSGALKQELSYQKTRIIGLINERLGNPFIEQLDVW